MSYIAQRILKIVTFTNIFRCNMFEWDIEKSKTNQFKHGISFEQAQRLWNDPLHLEIPAKFVDEPRSMVIGSIDKEIWSAIFTVREDKIRIISVRKSRTNEKELYKSF